MIFYYIKLFQFIYKNIFFFIIIFKIKFIKLVINNKQFLLINV